MCEFTEMNPYIAEMRAAQVLDPCCGSRMMWLDRQDQRALFGDNRDESLVVTDRSHRTDGTRALSIHPDARMDFRSLPFPDESFALVVFDPPHLVRAGRTSWLAAKYGRLGADWRDDLRAGFLECFRVLKAEGCLIFKWSEVQIPLRDVLALTSHKPLFGHPSGKRASTHWMTFLKPLRAAQSATPSPAPASPSRDALQALPLCRAGAGDSNTPGESA